MMLIKLTRHSLRNMIKGLDPFLNDKNKTADKEINQHGHYSTESNRWLWDVSRIIKLCDEDLINLYNRTLSTYPRIYNADAHIIAMVNDGKG